jgi:hypothetical protein
MQLLQHALNQRALLALPMLLQQMAHLHNALRGLLAVAEAYPDLKASSNFLALQEELSTTENKVSFRTSVL